MGSLVFVSTTQMRLSHKADNSFTASIDHESLIVCTGRKEQVKRASIAVKDSRRYTQIDTD